MGLDQGTTRIMGQTTSRMLFDYWNTLRGRRAAPERFEIEPAKIASLLPETFIIECGGLLSYRFRLAGTRICEQFGRELRGLDFTQLWNPSDREAVGNLLHSIVTESAIGAMTFDGMTREDCAAPFELLLLPLVHAGTRVNRIMGCITAIDPPYWLGTQPLIRLAVRSIDLDWVGAHAGANHRAAPAPSNIGGRQATAPGDSKRRFRVFDGGLSDRTD